MIIARFHPCNIRIYEFTVFVVPFGIPPWILNSVHRSPNQCETVVSFDYRSTNAPLYNVERSHPSIRICPDENCQLGGLYILSKYLNSKWMKSASLHGQPRWNKSVNRSGYFRRLNDFYVSCIYFSKGFEFVSNFSSKF